MDKGGGNGIDADAQASVLDGRVYAYQQCVQSNGRQTVKAERSTKQPKDECEYFGNFLFRADGTFVESDLDDSELQRGKWALSNNLLTLREEGYEYYADDLKVVELSSNKLVLEYYYEEEDGGVEYAKMTYKRK